MLIKKTNCFFGDTDRASRRELVITLSARDQRQLFGADRVDFYWRGSPLRFTAMVLPGAELIWMRCSVPR